MLAILLSVFFGKSAFFGLFRFFKGVTEMGTPLSVVFIPAKMQYPAVS